MSKLYIPDTVRVGFRNYRNLPSGRLSFITYFNEQNVLFLDTAWHSWCDPSIPYVDLPNTPNSFTLCENFDVNNFFTKQNMNKTIVVSDARGLNFYIEPRNFILLLANTQISGKQIHDPCVFAWYKTKLFLLPTTSPLYI